MEKDLRFLLRNDKRKAMLLAIHHHKRHYSELVDETGLKPGSIYHHLKVMEPLINKEEQGIYSITEIGRKLLQDMNLIDIQDVKPTIQINNSSTDDFQYFLFLGKINIILSFFVLFSIILLGINSVALAGSAIYAVPVGSIILYDLLAFFLGWGVLYFIELITKNSVYNNLWSTLTIRLSSMLPGSILGFSLYILYLTGISPNPEAFPILFAVSTSFGLLTATLGETYLRGRPKDLAVVIALPPVIIDILIGLVVLLSV